MAAHVEILGDPIVRCMAEQDKHELAAMDAYLEAVNHFADRVNDNPDTVSSGTLCSFGVTDMHARTDCCSA